MDAALYRAHAEMEREHWWFVGRRAIVGDVMDRWVGAGDVGRVLDLGCGTGGMLPLLARYGTVTAVEPEPYAVSHARDQPGGATVVHGEIPDNVPQTHDFGLVTAFDVIEHLDDDVGAIRAMKGAARPGGVVLVTVPALACLWSEHDVANGHRRRYTSGILVEALTKVGLAVEHVSYFNLALLPPIAAVRFAGRLRLRPQQGRNDFELGIPPTPVNRVLAAVLGAERRLVARRGLPVGVSLIAVARAGRP